MVPGIVFRKKLNDMFPCSIHRALSNYIQERRKICCLNLAFFSYLDIFRYGTYCGQKVVYGVLQVFVRTCCGIYVNDERDAGYSYQKGFLVAVVFSSSSYNVGLYAILQRWLFSYSCIQAILLMYPLT